MIHPQTTIRVGDQLLDLNTPQVMGILNVTPDSFFDGGQYDAPEQALVQAERMLLEGAAIIDVGGMSSRPGAKVITPEEERKRVLPVLNRLVETFPEAIISVDTVYSATVREVIAAGAHLINDISGGSFDDQMFETIAELRVPYVLMHMQGRPETMQQRPEYSDVTLEVMDFFIQRVQKLRALGVADIILDPGFGFGKSLEDNYMLLQKMHVFGILDCPILAGISRKSMINKVLGTKPETALNGTTALHMVALQQGAKLLRVHDVKEAVQVVTLWNYMNTING